jgi:cytoskeleton protein RodZ
MTLEEVSATTKISVRSLKALEQEKFDLLPGGIFNKGFVRSYAKHLGLDDEAVVSDYMEAAGESGPPPMVAEPTEANTSQETRPADSDPLPWGSMAVVVVLGTLLFVAWHFYSHRRTGESPNASGPVTASTTPAGPITTNAPIPTALAIAPAAGQNAAPAGGSTIATGAPSPDNSSPVSPEAAVSAVPPPTAQSGIGSFELLLQAKDEVWVSITVDSQPPSETTFAAGQTKTLHASDKIVMRVGNPPSLQVSMNGKRVPIRGVEGQPESLTFTASGLQPAGSAPSKPN